MPTVAVDRLSAPAGALRRHKAALAGALLATLWLAATIGLRPLALPEEGRYVGVAWEMLRSGHWLVPTENGLPFFHKPPLFYWLSAASMQAFGLHPAAARLPSLLAALLAVAGTWVVARRWAGERMAARFTLVVVTLPFFFAGAQFANLDMLVAAFMALSTVFAADATLRARAGLPHRPTVVAAWAAMALAVLAKGLIGIVLPGSVILAWLLVSGRARDLRVLLRPAGPLVFLAIAAPWFVAVQARFPGFFHFFFVYQHFERYLDGGFNNAQPWWFFFVAVPLLTLPWSLWLLRSSWRDRPGEPAAAGELRRLMWVWLAFVIVFFSLPQSKPVGYAMAVLFPLAWLVADAVCARESAHAGAPFGVVASATGAVLICCVAVAYVSLAAGRDNIAVAATLKALRAPGDPVVFAGEYFFDIPLAARLTEPVPVISDWHDPAIVRHDNWKRELAEGAAFAPDAGAGVLVDAEQGFALRCGSRPLWIVADRGDERRVSALPGAVNVEQSRRASLWRVGAEGCAASPHSSGGPPTSPADRQPQTGHE